MQPDVNETAAHDEAARQVAEDMFSVEEMADRASEQLGELRFVNLLLRSLLLLVFFYSCGATVRWAAVGCWTSIPKLLKMFLG